eukprot:CAMPEP_0183357294 /NCGR_PEP_ID=MMETSP0164_2-20130417/45790_1 /TAXON_ID=221442 /ORGANISM="Coccolithus pelagicus ssp braarudi, Strain PLY182g" /LENGTH=60 /DNA_ID=CAMNT_0025530879 /DNA_START=487 /DNA_END=669 /DNA_ORIENTATION=-
MLQVGEWHELCVLELPSRGLLRLAHVEELRLVRRKLFSHILQVRRKREHAQRASARHERT